MPLYGYIGSIAQLELVYSIYAIKYPKYQTNRNRQPKETKVTVKIKHKHGRRNAPAAAVKKKHTFCIFAIAFLYLMFCWQQCSNVFIGIYIFSIHRYVQFCICGTALRRKRINVAIEKSIFKLYSYLDDQLNLRHITVGGSIFLALFLGHSGYENVVFDVTTNTFPK